MENKIQPPARISDGFHSLRSLFIALILPCLAFSSQAQPPNPDDCYRADLEPRLGWLTSGAWSETASEPTLLLADASRNHLVELGTDGRRIDVLGSVLRREDGAATDLIRPTSIRSADGTLAVEDDAVDQIRRLGERRELVHTLPVRQSAGEAGQIAAIYDWMPLGDGILAFVDLEPAEHGETAWRNAFVYYDSAGGFDLFYELGTPGPETPEERAARVAKKYHYLFNYPYLSVIDGFGYILTVHEAVPRILEVRPGVVGFREVGTLPGELGHRPELLWEDDWNGRRRQYHFQRALEQSNTVVGLIAWQGKLYVMSKAGHLSTQGRTATWTLSRVSRSTGVVQASYTVPSTSPHLVAVPGERWAFVEKSAVIWLPTTGRDRSGTPFSEAASMVIAPGTWFQGESSGGSGVVASCRTLGR